jgi:hypothetical protein
MAPSATEQVTQATEHIKQKLVPGTEGKDEDNSKAVEANYSDVLPELLTGHREPLKLSGALDEFDQFDVTPVIGREFSNVDLAEWLRAPNSDELLRDLAITSKLVQYSSPTVNNSNGNGSSQVSQRGVVFFRKQDNITDGLQKELVQRLGELSGKPATSKLHIHPVNNACREDGGNDDEITLISSRLMKRIYADKFLTYGKDQSQKKQWHSDITFEPVPSDYALLRLTELPKTGGGK